MNRARIVEYQKKDLIKSELDMFPVLDSHHTLATLSFVSSSTDTKPLLSDGTATRPQLQFISKIYRILPGR